MHASSREAPKIKTVIGSLVASFIALLSLSQLARVEAASLEYSLPDWSIYHTKENLLNKVRAVVAKNPMTMKMEERQNGVGNYNVSIPVVTVEPGGLSHHQDAKIRLLMSFGEHGREIISTELALKLLECLDGDGHLEKCIQNENALLEVQSILPFTVIKIIPVENPVGREIVEKGKLCERKNGRGVDINRNWDIDFGKKELDYDPHEEYPGPYAFSEPETVILKALVEDFHPHVWVAVHSGMCAVFMPYDHVGHMPSGKSAEAQLKILKALKEENLHEGCKFGPGGKTVGYVAHGTATDYMYSVLKIPLTFTWEIFGDTKAGYHDCFRMFNPRTLPEVKVNPHSLQTKDHGPTAGDDGYLDWCHLPSHQDAA